MRWAAPLIVALLGAPPLLAPDPVDLELSPVLTTKDIERYADAVRGGGTVVWLSDGTTLIVTDAGPGPRILTEQEIRIRSEVTVLGTLQPEFVNAAARRSRKQILACQERASVDGGNRHGLAVVKFVASPRGTVSAASVQLTSFDGATDACLISVVRSWVFPPSSNGGVAIVTYPFRFPPDP